MYAFLKGIIAEKNVDYIIIDVHDVGYLIKISSAMIALLPPIGEMVKIFTYTSVREDDISLFGFLTKDELDIFKLLINVNGIGPKAGQSILSVLSADALRFAIVSQDAKAIAKAPGIGSKTAQRVILDLKDKISLEETLQKNKSNISTEVRDEGTVATSIREAIEALVALGYQSSEALKSVQLVEHADEMDTEQVLKMALKNLF